MRNYARVYRALPLVCTVPCIREMARRRIHRLRFEITNRARVLLPILSSGHVPIHKHERRSRMQDRAIMPNQSLHTNAGVGVVVIRILSGDSAVMMVNVFKAAYISVLQACICMHSCMYVCMRACVCPYIVRGHSYLRVPSWKLETLLWPHSSPDSENLHCSTVLCACLDKTC